MSPAYALVLVCVASTATAMAMPQRGAETGVAVTVTDRSGNRLADVRVEATGPVTRDARTDEQGQVRFTDLEPGKYRFRYVVDGFIPFEREVVVTAGRVQEEWATLSGMPVTARPEPASEPAAPEASAGEPTSVVVDAFLDSNRIGNDDPNRDTEIGCTADARVVLHQLRDLLEARAPEDRDTILYVVDGEGILRLGEAPHKLVPSMIVVIPRGISFSVRREGRRTLAVLLTEAGVPCTASEKN